MNSGPARNHRRRLQVGAFAALVAVIVAAALLALPGARLALGLARTPEKLTIADASQPAFALVYVADAKGYFRDGGLEVSFNVFSLGRDALANVIEGKADIATVYETPTVIRMHQGNDLGILSTLHTSSRGHALIARRDRGIAQPADLRGRRIGVTRGTSMEYFLSIFLATEGIPATDIHEVQVEPADYEKVLREGMVDALVAFNPHRFRLQGIFGDERSVTFYSKVFTEASLLVGQRENIHEKREAHMRLMRAIVRAQDFVERNAEESIDIVVRRLAGRYPKTAIRGTWDSLRIEAKLDNVLLALFTQEGQWFRDSGRFQTPVPDFRRAIVTDYLQSVKPGAVTLLARPEPR